MNEVIIFFPLIVIPLVAFFIITYFNRCKNCNSWKYGFESEFITDEEANEVYKVCKKCRFKKLKGRAYSEDGNPIIYSGMIGDGGGDCGDGGGGGDC